MTTTVERRPINLRKKILLETSGEQQKRLLLINKSLRNIRENRRSACIHAFLGIICFVVALSFLILTLTGHDFGEGASMAMTTMSISALAGAGLFMLRGVLGNKYVELVIKLRDGLEGSGHGATDVAWLDNAEPGTAQVIDGHLKKIYD